MSRARRLFPVAGLVVALPATAGSLAPDLREALRTASEDDRIPVVVMMEGYPDRQRMLDEVRLTAEKGLVVLRHAVAPVSLTVDAA